VYFSFFIISCNLWEQVKAIDFKNQYLKPGRFLPPESIAS